MNEGVTPETKVRILEKSNVWETEDEHIQFKQTIEVYHALKRKKHRAKHEIVFFKQFEKLLDAVYNGYVESGILQFSKEGFTQLAAFCKTEEHMLSLWAYDSIQGETDMKYPLSSVFQYELNEDSIAEPDLLCIYHSLVKEVSNLTELIPIANLPNLSVLGSEQFLAVRTAMSTVRRQLAELLPLSDTEHHGKRYLIGTWDRAGLAQLAPSIQHTIDTLPEMKRAFDFTKDNALVVSVGSMETVALWNLLRKNDLLPDDTWVALEKSIQSGIHCPHVPILAVASKNEEEQTRNLSIPEIEQQRRRTLDID